MGKIILKSDWQKIHVKLKSAYVTRTVSYSTVSSEDLLARAAENSQLSKGSIRAALLALTQEMRNYLVNGHGIQVPSLGTFSFAVRAHATDDVETAGAPQVYRRKMGFTPSGRMKKDLADVNFDSLPQE